MWMKVPSIWYLDIALDGLVPDPLDGFIQYVKEHEHPALIFYANYPLATVGEVRRALDWKNKTQKFIEKDVPKLLKWYFCKIGIGRYENL